MDFFDDGDGDAPDLDDEEDEDEQDDEHPGLPEWFGPPELTLGVTVPQRQVLHRSEHVVVALTHTVSFRTGVTFSIEVAARRGEWSRRRWTDLEQSFWGERHARRHPMGGEGDLRFGVRLADGSTARLGGGERRRFDLRPTDPPAGPLLLERGGGGSGGGRTLIQQSKLWLWPLPPPGPIDLFVVWEPFEVAETSVRLDGAEIVRAAERAERFWPE